MQEQDLIARVIKGDKKVFKQLFEKHKQMVFQTALGLLHHKDWAEDVLQEVFIEVYQSIHTFRGDSKFTTWLYRIAVNRSLNYLRSHKNRSKHISLVENEKSSGINKLESADSFDPQKKLEQVENAHALHLAVNSLPENQRIAFVLAKYNDLSYAEIAETMHTSVSSVESLLFRAKKGLQKKLLEFYKKS
ncbi:RNA polymerase sigma factor [Labilibacter sediminis]|nr:RNA polymerase sigma factor [Labilibacter sediminis]